MPAAPAPAAQAMQAHSKAYKAIAWPKLWPAPAQGRGPAHSQGQTREHCNGRGSNQRPGAQPAVAQRFSLEERESLVEGCHIPAQAAVQLPPLHAHFRSDLRHRAGSCAVERRAEGHWLSSGMPSPVLGCRPGSQSHISESRSPPAAVGTLRKGPPLPPSAEAVQNFTFLPAALCPEHPRAGLQLIRDQGGYTEPGRAGCSIPGAPAHLHPPYGSASATAASLPPTEAGGRMGVTSLGFSYPGDGERHAEILPPLQPEAPGCRPIQHHLVGLHVAHLCKGRGCDPSVRECGNNAERAGEERARCLAG